MQNWCTIVRCNTRPVVTLAPVQVFKVNEDAKLRYFSFVKRQMLTRYIKRHGLAHLTHPLENVCEFPHVPVVSEFHR